MSTSVPRAWLAWSSITAAVIGCQALITSGAPQQRLVVMLPSGAEDAPLRQRFLQGFSIGATSVSACGQSMPPVHWQNLRPDDSPLARLPRSSGLQLVVAPPSADVRAFAALSRQQQLTVLFPFQRGRRTKRSATWTAANGSGRWCRRFGMTSGPRLKPPSMPVGAARWW